MLQEDNSVLRCVIIQELRTISSHLLSCTGQFDSWMSDWNENRAVLVASWPVNILVRLEISGNETNVTYNANQAAIMIQLSWVSRHRRKIIMSISNAHPRLGRRDDDFSYVTNSRLTSENAEVNVHAIRFARRRCNLRAKNLGGRKCFATIEILAQCLAVFACLFLFLLDYKRSRRRDSC